MKIGEALVDMHGAYPGLLNSSLKYLREMGERAHSYGDTDMVAKRLLDEGVTQVTEVIHHQMDNASALLDLMIGRPTTNKLLYVIHVDIRGYALLGYSYDDRYFCLMQVETDLQ